MNNTLSPLFWLLLLLSAFLTQAQDSLNQIPNGEVIQDTRIDRLIKAHIQVNIKQEGMDGYRIQIFFDSGAQSKIRAQEAYDQFIAKYPNTPVYLSFQTPNYKVRVGDFRTRLDALKTLNKIEIDYPNAFIITDRINLPTVDP